MSVLLGLVTALRGPHSPNLRRGSSIPVVLSQLLTFLSGKFIVTFHQGKDQLMRPLTSSEAADALAVAEPDRRQVLGRVGVPGWYWWSVALGWIALGVITDLRPPLVTSIASFVF